MRSHSFFYGGYEMIGWLIVGSLCAGLLMKIASTPGNRKKRAAAERKRRRGLSREALEIKARRARYLAAVGGEERTLLDLGFSPEDAEKRARWARP